MTTRILCSLALLTLAPCSAALADMSEDSPVTFPKQGALPSKYPPDRGGKAEPAEKDYYILNHKGR